MMTRSHVRVTCCLLLAACGGDSRRTPSFQAVDSAGVCRVTNVRPLLPDTAAWEVDTTPMFVIGGNSDDTTAMVQSAVGVCGSPTAP